MVPGWNSFIHVIRAAKIEIACSTKISWVSVFRLRKLWGAIEQFSRSFDIVSVRNRSRLDSFGGWWTTKIRAMPRSTMIRFNKVGCLKTAIVTSWGAYFIFQISKNKMPAVGLIFLFRLFRSDATSSAALWGRLDNWKQFWNAQELLSDSFILSNRFW